MNPEDSKTGTLEKFSAGIILDLVVTLNIIYFLHCGHFNINPFLISGAET
jgi:hypothetical protein